MGSNTDYKFIDNSSDTLIITIQSLHSGTVHQNNFKFGHQIVPPPFALENSANIYIIRMTIY